MAGESASGCWKPNRPNVKTGPVSVACNRIGGGVALLSRKPPDPVPTCFDDYKRSCEFFLCMGTQNSLKFSMHGILSGRQYAQIQDSGAQCMHEHQVAIVPITCYEDAALLLSSIQYLFIFSRQPHCGHLANIMPQVTQEPCCDRIHVLI